MKMERSSDAETIDGKMGPAFGKFPKREPTSITQLLTNCGSEMASKENQTGLKSCIP